MERCTVAKKKSEPVKSRKGVPGGKGAWKLMDRGATIGAGVLARRLSALTWQAATRRKPPASGSHPDADVREVVLWAVVGGAIVELTKVLVHRGTATYWVRSTGELPPGMKSLKTPTGEPVAEDPVRKVKKRFSRRNRGR
jgi:uncharacterized protein DUF4235